MASSDEYSQLQQRMFLAMTIVSVVAVTISAVFFGFHTSTSLLVGVLCSFLYLRLLARSIEKLGVSSQRFGKVQLLVPVLLVIAASRLQTLDLLPALVGFLLYKPSLIMQVMLESRTRASA